MFETGNLLKFNALPNQEIRITNYFSKDYPQERNMLLLSRWMSEHNFFAEGKASRLLDARPCSPPTGIANVSEATWQNFQAIDELLN